MQVRRSFYVTKEKHYLLKLVIAWLRFWLVWQEEESGGGSTEAGPACREEDDLLVVAAMNLLHILHCLRLTLIQVK